MLIAAALLTGATPVTADRQRSETNRQADALEEARQALATLDRARFLQEPDYAKRIVQQLERLEQSSPPADVLLGLRHLKMIGYLTTGRNAEAVSVSKLLIQADPGEPGAYIGAFLGALADGKEAGALSAVEQAAGAVRSEEGKAALYDLFSRDTVYDLNRDFHQAKDKESRFRLARALVKIDWPGPKQIEDRDNFRSVFAREQMERGDRDAAASLAATIIAPSPLLDLLVLREYDPLFDPSVDRVERIKSALQSYDKATEEALASDRESLDLLLARAQFLRSVGRDAEVLSLVQPLLSDMEAVGRSGNQAFWIVNEAAYSLVSLGRAPEAVQLIDGLLKLDMKAHPELINMSINKGAILNHAGRHAEAFEHATRIERSQGEYASAYGKMWMAATAVCALAAQGRTEEARSRLERLTKDADSNQSAATRAMLCVNDLDGAERLLLKRLASDEPLEAVLAIQKHQIGGTPTHSDAVVQRWEAVGERPQVKAALDKVGRRLSLPTARTYWGRY